MTNDDAYDFSDLDDCLSDTGATAAAVVDGTTHSGEPTADPLNVGLMSRDEATRKFSIDKPPLYFDLETVPDYDRMADFGFEPLPEAMPETPDDDLPPRATLLAGTVTDVEKLLRMANPMALWLGGLASLERDSKKPREGVLKAIDKCLATKNAHVEALDARRKLMSTTPEFCKIVALGYAQGNSLWSLVVGQPLAADGHTNMNEIDLLSFFWEVAARSGSFVGFNIAAFDIPVILVRSILLGVPATRMIDVRAFNSRDVCDLMTLRFFGRMAKPMKLKSLARAMGIEVPAGDTDGGDVERLWREEPGELREYVESDVTITRELHRKYQGYFCL